LAEHRERFQDGPDGLVALEDAHQVGQGTLAVAAGVIEEFDGGDVALRVAELDLSVRVVEHVRSTRHRLGLGLFLLFLLAALKLDQGLANYLRVSKEIIAHDAFYRGAILVRHIGTHSGRQGGRYGDQDGEGRGENTNAGHDHSKPKGAPYCRSARSVEGLYDSISPAYSRAAAPHFNFCCVS